MTYSKIFQPNWFSWVSLSTLIYTSELILCSSICVHSATRHNIYMIFLSSLALKQLKRFSDNQVFYAISGVGGFKCKLMQA